jgi:hypothetical protein
MKTVTGESVYRGDGHSGGFGWGFTSGRGSGCGAMNPVQRGNGYGCGEPFGNHAGDSVFDYLPHGDVIDMTRTQ